ncbi:MAG: sigma-54 dependent transcriptional regulator [Desulfobacterales bacterium]|jgi:DNA-binding NtrC family response regulator|nr:sigma-54 dependent transcriptional regulator [Desulfobacterales bacterium]
MKQNLRPAYPILVIDDEEAILLAIDTTLRMAGFNHIITCRDSRKAMGLIAEHHAQVILMDLMMPHINGQDLLVEIAAEFPDIPVIIITVAVDPKTVVKCMKRGAFDYLVKPVDADRLRTTVINAQHFSELQQENLALKNSMLTDEVSHMDAFSSIITRNRKMLAVFKYLELISKTNQAVLITGETGVGKELVAKAIHELSGVSGPFVSVNVAGLDDNIFSDTLFGHVKGAFTGADTHRMGLIEAASSGTLLLDEIGDLSLTSQVKLLRLLQESEYRPLGMDKTKKAHVRMVASTNEGLNELRSSGKFRKDLLFRLQVHHVHIPSLRERLDDIGLLLNYFIRLAATELNKTVPSYPKELSALLQTYSFPGNVRELKAMVFDAVSRHTKGILSLQVFQNYLNAQRPFGLASAPSGNAETIIFPARLPTIEEATQALLDEAMKRANGNQSLAARLLGVSQQAVSKRLQKGK